MDVPEDGYFNLIFAAIKPKNTLDLKIKSTLQRIRIDRAKHSNKLWLKSGLAGLAASCLKRVVNILITSGSLGKDALFEALEVFFRFKFGE